MMSRNLLRPNCNYTNPLDRDLSAGLRYLTFQQQGPFFFFFSVTHGALMSYSLKRVRAFQIELQFESVGL